MMTHAAVEKVSDTAFGIAHYRAVETERSDALFHDPLAKVLAGERGKEIAAAMPMPFMVEQIVVIRTCVIDGYIRMAIDQGVDTVVNLGAGLDTRPYRLDLPNSLRWIEADYPDVIEFKEKRLSGEKPRCQLERVQLDLADVAERQKLLVRVGGQAKKTFVLTEGVISYWSVEEVGSLADDLKALGQACYWVVDYFSPEVVKYRQRSRIGRKMRNAPFKFAPTDWLGFFREHGWRPKEIRYLAEEAERLHRPIQLPVLLKLTIGVRNFFATKERQANLKRYLGYAILEPALG
jgi:methyltransferase (TIGR00027 family)